MIMTQILKQKPKIYIIHENEEWIIPLKKELDKLQFPYVDWFINTGEIDLTAAPPKGVFYNRMSASSHTRNHRYAVEFTEPLLCWLQAHGRRVVNNRNSILLEVRKAEQYLALNKYGIKTPKTFVVSGKEFIRKVVKKFDNNPFILKPNRGGKGIGVQLFKSINRLEEVLNNDWNELSLDGITLVQEYIEPKDGCIVRVEFIGGEYYYAVRVDASDGFELCPADDCHAEDVFCPTTENVSSKKEKFEIIKNYYNPDLDKYKAFLKNSGMEIAAIEYVENKNREKYVYDVNVNTNYNSLAEKKHGEELSGMRQIALFLGEEIKRIQ